MSKILNSDKNRKDSDQNTKVENERIEKLVNVGRITKVVKGGKNLRFRALVIIGDGKGKVGFGCGKAKEVPDAVRKASQQAERAMIKVPLREGRTLHHDVKGTFGAGNVNLRMAPAGTGIIAGGPMRAIFEALGINDIVSKSVGTSNYYNMVRATFDALSRVTSPRDIAAKLGRPVQDIIARRDAALVRR